jgi:transketolase
LVYYPDDAIIELERKANVIRRHIIRMTRAAGSGHPGGSLSSTDILSALFFRVMHHHPSDPAWEDRDRFVLSKGHAAPAYYAALAEAGYFPVEELLTLRKLGSRLQGHPSKNRLPGVEMSTGSLGQGLSVANGMALAAKLDRKAYRIYCLCGDGEMQSGQIWEAAMLGAHYELDNLTAFLDRNKLQIDGPTEKIMSLEPLADKWKAFGWHVVEIDGHNLREILDACDKAREVRNKPTMVLAHTVKGKGVSFMENALSFHGKSPNDEETKKALRELGEDI